MNANEVRLSVRLPKTSESKEVLELLNNLILKENGAIHGYKAKRVLKYLKLGLMLDGVPELQDDIECNRCMDSFLEHTHKEQNVDVKVKSEQQKLDIPKPVRIVKNVLESLKEKNPNGFTYKEYQNERIAIIGSGKDYRTINGDLRIAEETLKMIRLHTWSKVKKYVFVKDKFEPAEPEQENVIDNSSNEPMTPITPEEYHRFEDLFINEYRDKTSISKVELREFIKEHTTNADSTTMGAYINFLELIRGYIEPVTSELFDVNISA